MLTRFWTDFEEESLHRKTSEISARLVDSGDVSEITEILCSTSPSDEHAAERLLPLVYESLRKLAMARMAKERPGQTLQATALVHEAWLKIAGEDDRVFANQKQFFKAAANAMERILIDAARRKQRVKHGSNQPHEPIHELQIAVIAPTEEMLAVSDALTLLEREEPKAAEVVRLRYFVGMSIAEIAEALDVTPRTIDRHWAYARAWLKSEIRASLSNDPDAPES